MSKLSHHWWWKDYSLKLSWSARLRAHFRLEIPCKKSSLDSRRPLLVQDDTGIVGTSFSAAAVQAERILLSSSAKARMGSALLSICCRTSPSCRPRIQIPRPYRVAAYTGNLYLIERRPKPRAHGYAEVASGWHHRTPHLWNQSLFGSGRSDICTACFPFCVLCGCALCCVCLWLFFGYLVWVALVS